MPVLQVVWNDTNGNGPNYDHQSVIRDLEIFPAKILLTAKKQEISLLLLLPEQMERQRLSWCEQPHDNMMEPFRFRIKDIIGTGIKNNRLSSGK